MPPARRTETLAKIPLFRSLAAADVARLDTQCSWRHAPSGQWLLDHQDASSDVFACERSVAAHAEPDRAGERAKRKQQQSGKRPQRTSQRPRPPLRRSR